MLTISSSILPSFNFVCNRGESGITKLAYYQNYTIGNITCPHIERMCDNKYCLNNCSMHGFCSRGQCFCNPGYSGQDCS